MVKLYTAVGRFEAKPKIGGKIPTVTVNMKEAELQIDEMILWSCLIWNIVIKDEARSAFEKKALEYSVDPEKFDAVLERLQVRHLVVSAEADRGDEALYKLLANLYVIPMTSSLSAKIKVFFRLILRDRVPVSVAKIIFRRENFSCL